MYGEKVKGYFQGWGVTFCDVSILCRPICICAIFLCSEMMMSTQLNSNPIQSYHIKSGLCDVGKLDTGPHQTKFHKLLAQQCRTIYCQCHKTYSRALKIPVRL